MLACARIGAMHSVVFGGFSPDSLAGRIADSRRKVVITADEGLRGGKHVPLKVNVDEALTRPGTNSVETVLVVRRTGGAVTMQAPRDRWWHTLIEGQAADCAPDADEAEDPLFILYTSGSTGKPKGVLHTTGGYLASSPATRTNACSTCAKTTSTGAPPTSAGSPATATSSTARSPTARPR